MKNFSIGGVDFLLGEAILNSTAGVSWFYKENVYHRIHNEPNKKIKIIESILTKKFVLHILSSCNQHKTSLSEVKGRKFSEVQKSFLFHKRCTDC